MGMLKTDQIQTYETREAWLLAAMDKLADLFAGPVPKARVSVGWPGGRGPKATVRGQCWHTKASEDAIGAIFISPIIAEPIIILAVLAHEMCHLVDNCEHGHKKEFILLARSIGLEGPKWTSAKPSLDLLASLTIIEGELGHYPHAAMAAPGTKGGDPVQGTRMIKVACSRPECETFDPAKGEGYVLRTTRKWLDAFGAPMCPSCDEFMDF